MNDYRQDFGPFEKNVSWLNTASEGAMPRVAVEALNECIKWKINPHNLTIPKFTSTVYYLKKSLAQLINADADDIIVANSATYGIHLLANGIEWKEGDEILLMQNDFPTDILPWLFLKEKGVKVHQLKPTHHVLTPEEVAKHINANTKVICLSQVHTFTGHAINVERIGELCKKNKTLFVLNCSQSLGNTPVDVSQLPVDAITSAGYKWLLGPYSTGFCWMKKELREQLNYPQAYWSSMLSDQELSSTEEITLPHTTAAKRYDMFAPANFFNYIPWKASIDYLMEVGIENIQKHNRELIDLFLEELDHNKYQIISPLEKERRTNLIVISHQDPNRNEEIFETLKKEKIYGALWKNLVRFSPHVFNTKDEINRLIKVVNSL